MKQQKLDLIKIQLLITQYYQLRPRFFFCCAKILNFPDKFNFICLLGTFNAVYLLPFRLPTIYIRSTRLFSILARE